ncbi:MAG: transcriptional repressor [Candidatus Moranbacteria bacterium]|nr:transcriptional repressor [Candidatus Moranbacteria bacterium]
MRSTVLSRAVSEIFRSHRGPITIPQLREFLHAKGLSAHKTTLYRIVRRLCEAGMVEELMLDTSVAYYEMQRVHHHHAVCSVCEHIFCLSDLVIERGLRRVGSLLSRHGFFFIDHQFSLHGLCKACQK